MTLLRIDSSARENSVSRRLTAEFVDGWRQRHPDASVVDRDLANTALPLITEDWSATFLDATAMTQRQRLYLTVSDQLIDELFAANVIVVGAPMYNFSIAAPLKAWIDQVVRVGKTVAYTASGPKGLLQGRQVIVISSRGGSYLSPTGRPDNFHEPYLRAVFGFMGLTDVTFVHAENQAQAARAEIERTAASARLAQLVTRPPQEAIVHGAVETN
jgi:FMN-dependent NADH-azoreductase